MGRERIEEWPGMIYSSTCRDKQFRQGGDHQDSTEIERVGRDTEDDKS